MAKRDVIGHRFGRLVAIRYVDDSRNHAIWKCDCGNEKRVYIYSVLNGDTRSCGCLNTELTAKRNIGTQHHIDITGKRFGRLTAIQRNGITSNRITIWTCKCDCGGSKDISARSLRSGLTRSCGCLQKETARLMMTKHGRYRDRDYINELGDKRRAMKTGAFVERVFRAKVYERDIGLCQICGLPVEDGESTLDHAVPLFRGGTHSYKNCRTAHASCNFKKALKLPEECEHLWRRS